MPELDGQYTVFGNVLYGMETLELISNKPTDSNDNPLDRVVIRDTKLLPREQLPPPPAPVAPDAKPEDLRQPGHVFPLKAKEGGVLDLALEHGLIQKSGSFFSHGETRLGQGRNNTKEHLRDNRLSLLQRVLAPFARVADFRALAVQS